MAVKLFCGLLFGQLGRAYDALAGDGMTKLAGRIRALSKDILVVGPLAYDQDAILARNIKELPKGTPIVVGGVSLGACNAPRVPALVYPRPVDFIFGIQPSQFGGRQPVPRNVKRAWFCYQPTSSIWTWLPILGWGLGSAKWVRAADNPVKGGTVMVSAYSYSPHPGDSDEGTQQIILAEIKKLL